MALLSKNLMPRQQLPKVYYQNACIDVFRPRVVLNQHSMSGDFILGYEMKENYRNASQVTEHCNQVFGMEMKPINTPGKGVHELKDLLNKKD